MNVKKGLNHEELLVEHIIGLRCPLEGNGVTEDFQSESCDQGSDLYSGKVLPVVM